MPDADKAAEPVRPEAEVQNKQPQQRTLGKSAEETDRHGRGRPPPTRAPPPAPPGRHPGAGHRPPGPGSGQQRGPAPLPSGSGRSGSVRTAAELLGVRVQHPRQRPALPVQVSMCTGQATPTAATEHNGL